MSPRKRLAAASAGSIAVAAFDPDAAPAPAQASARSEDTDTPPARIAHRRFVEVPRLHSFSSLHARSSEEIAPRGAVDLGPDWGLPALDTFDVVLRSNVATPRANAFVRELAAAFRAG